MRRFLGWLACTLLGAAGAAHGQSAPQWRLQFFHDEDQSALNIIDLQFPSAARGIGCGVLVAKKSVKPAVLVSSDGGARWALTPVREACLSLHFVDESRGWIVTEKGILKTEDSGRNWKKISSQAGLWRVWFADPSRGWAVGTRRSFLETHDGGVTWTPVAIQGEMKTTQDYTTFGWIHFAGPSVGVVTGWSRPPRRRESRLPDYVDPEEAKLRGQRPTLTLLVQTLDGGKTWRPAVTSMFGQITRLRLHPEGRALGLIEFTDWFQFRSEVFRIDLHSGRSQRVFRQQDRSVTDIALPAQGPAYLASIDTPGELKNSPVPGKVRVFRSDDLVRWEEMSVDYRAVATRATLAAADSEHIWLATDSGMILKLSRR